MKKVIWPDWLIEEYNVYVINLDDGEEVMTFEEFAAVWNVKPRIIEE
ncbi:hypothetical protein ABQ642_000744 [Escherichia coli]|nr:hypothetical protein [Escherichia coli]EFB4074732.1 hypothetical protein [Escherichia coli O91]EEQ2862771.1 hypothetical protein [Escherichia coli]EEQ4435345.1 hypothetical protein [Escherichia coli]EEQ9097187.1 hypothetical protein [Escherichia coli]EEX3882044.1 hypothetical protein [Escherichia coli]